MKNKKIKRNPNPELIKKQVTKLFGKKVAIICDNNIYGYLYYHTYLLDPAKSLTDFGIDIEVSVDDPTTRDTTIPFRLSWDNGPFDGHLLYVIELNDIQKIEGRLIYTTKNPKLFGT